VADSAAVSLLRRHRQWALLIAVAAGVLVVAGAISLTIVEAVSKGPAFQSAAAFVRSDPTTRQQLGVVLGFGLAVTGPISDAGSGGTANISFDVDGSWRSGHVRITAVKQGDAWVVRGGVLTVDGSRYRVPCTQTSSTTACRLS
jgi:Cytochrome oxidase complex assembly protein 1